MEDGLILGHMYIINSTARNVHNQKSQTFGKFSRPKRDLYSPHNRWPVLDYVQACRPVTPSSILSASLSSIKSRSEVARSYRNIPILPMFYDPTGWDSSHDCTSWYFRSSYRYQWDCIPRPSAQKSHHGVVYLHFELLPACDPLPRHLRRGAS